MTDLSIIIPSRNEMFLENTVQDILRNMRADTEIIIAADCVWPDPPVPVHERVSVVWHYAPIGQRAAMNEAAKISRGRYIMKCDAHCAFDEGFDAKMLDIMQPDVAAVPMMLNLHAFDWACECGERFYQGPTPEKCPRCGGQMRREMIWQPRKNTPHSTSYCFDPTPHFQYFNEYRKRPEGKGDLTETMSLQGSCFMLTREKYFELNIADESFGSWGSQGIEVAVKTWLSGGRVLCNHKTWYAHMFRTQGGDFGFPYSLSQSQVVHAQTTARSLFFENKWPGQVKPLSWLIEKFWPVPGWSIADLERVQEAGRAFGAAKVLTKGIVYYTDNRLDDTILRGCQKQLKRSINGHQVVSVSLQPMDFGQNIVLDLTRGYLAMFKQILAGLEALDTDIAYLCEHDVLYHPSHFDFIPPRQDTYYYNLAMWKVDYTTGHAVHYDTKQTSGLCAYRELLLEHYRERVRRTEEKLQALGDSYEYRNWIRRQGFEPGSHGRAERVDDHPSDTWESRGANLDIRHEKNLTPTRWRQDQFRDRRNCQNWQEAESVPGWYEAGKIGELFNA